ncbi:MAG: SIMPL domain-containing protein [Streptosporangiales bacterium]|nr:SIMPL domain-containing protein [Streptosporangiales bacterium]
MTQQTVISVRGQSRIEAEPEIARLTVTMQARHADRQTVVERLAARNKQVLDLVKEYGEAIEKVESGAASIRPDIRPKEKTERVRSYQGRATALVKIRDFTVLGELMTRLPDSELVTVDGPWWSLRPDSQVYRQARIDAAKEAMRRAGDYAQAFGGELGGLIEAADTGLLTDQSSERSTFYAARGAAVGGAAPGGAWGGEPDSMEFEPATQVVTAQVEARFEMIQPADPSPVPD